MSNYANTKATIAANVYENHLNQVTANMAKAAMNSIVDALIAGGFLYKGVAHPGDAAVSPDANVFYIASEAGTYTNKGGLVVADGEVAILKYNGSWSKEVTGAATAAEVSALGHKVDDLTEGADYTTPSLSVTNNKFIHSNGSVANAAGYAYTEKFFVSKGQKIIVKARGYLTNVAMISKVVTENTSYISVASSIDSTERTYEYIAQEDGYFAASYNAQYSHSVSIAENTPGILSARIGTVEAGFGGIASDISSFKKELTGAIASDLSPVLTSGKYINANGSIYTNVDYSYSEKFYAEKGQQILLRAKGYLTSIAMIAEVLVEDSSYAAKVVSVDSTIRDYSYIVEKSGYYAISFRTADGYSAFIGTNTPASLSKRIDWSNEFDLPEDLYFGIPVVGVIGDSLSSGATYNPNIGSISDNIDFAWWKVLARRSAMTYRRFCEGGMSTQNFITRTTYGLAAALTAGNECNVYIVALGVNDRSLGSSYLGTIADIDMDDPDNNADSFFGNYGRIIQKITAFNPGCKFLLFTIPRVDDGFNSAIRTLASTFSNCYLVDLWELYSGYFVAGGFFSTIEDGYSHYPAMAYAAMAKLFEKAINDCMYDNRADFKNIQFQ